MNKILVPVDFSDASLNALDIAAQIALKTGAELYMMHVNELVAYALPVSEYAYTAPYVEIESYEKEAFERLKQLRSDLQSKYEGQKLRIECCVKDGVLIPTVDEQVKEEGIDLVVMGTLGAGGWKEAFIGSNTERMIRHSTCPVFVVPRGIDILKVKRVLIPSTLKEDQKSVFQTAKTWQDLFGFDVQVLYVNDPLNAPTNGTIETQKNRLAEEAGLVRPYLHIYGLAVSKETAIRQYADQMEADLLIMGTHQRKGLSHLLFGSTTEDTINHTHVPILAVPLK